MQRSDGLPTIGLAVIARDEEEALGVLLDSVGWTDISKVEGATTAEGGGHWRPDAAVDFVVVCDTGSEDDTKRVAELRGCKVVEQPWTDDFSVARQASYDAIPPVDFTLWADCDDVIEGADLLRQLGARMPSFIVGTIHRYNYAQDPVGNCITELWRERLVRYGYGTWKLPVHEVLDVTPHQLMHSDQVEWRHRAGELEKSRDPERNYKILKRHRIQAERKGEDADPRTLAYLGTEAMTLGRGGEAVELFNEYLGRSDTGWSDERCQIAHKLSIALRVLANQELEGEDPDEEAAAQLVAQSEDAAVRALLERPDWPDGYLDLAELCLRREEPERALYFCDRASALEPPKTLLITNPLEYAYQPLLMKSVALAKLGRNQEAFDATQQALAMTPYRDDLKLQAATVGVALKQEEAIQHFMALREILVRHDENAKARTLMDCAPYFIWTNPAIAQARLDQREMTLHADAPSVYSSYYRDNPGEAPFEEQGLPIEEAHERFHRLALLRQHLDRLGKERKGGIASLRVLDLSCNDGWMLRNLADGGYGVKGKLDGMDLNHGAAVRARKRLKDQPTEVVEADLFTAPEHFKTSGYDAVVCYETIEHVPDPAALLDLMVKMTAKKGLAFVSTPDGAFAQGQIPEWSTVESKGHLRAMRAYEVADLLCARGVVEDFGSEQGLLYGVLAPEPARKRIHFFAGGVDAAPEKVYGEGLGGSETALVKMAEHFSRLGHDVRVFAGEGVGGLRGDYMTVGETKRKRQVLYAPAAQWDPGEPCDLFISSRYPEAFDRTIDAPQRVLWLHDHEYGDRLRPEHVERTTEVVVLSDFQRGAMAERYPFLEGKMRVSRNGIETSFFDGDPGRKKPWLVFSSSPDRGLDVLLECWPEIAKRAKAAGVKKPQLHHTYAPVYAQFREAYPHLQKFHARVQELEAAAGDSVVAHDHLGQKDLADLYRQAMVWSYPSWNTWAAGPFPEISCISAMEAQAAGCVPVYTDYAALQETVVAGVPVALDTAENGAGLVLTDAWREAFISACVKALTNSKLRSEVKRKARPKALELDWAGVAKEWERTYRLRPSPQREKVTK